MEREGTCNYNQLIWLTAWIYHWCVVFQEYTRPLEYSLSLVGKYVKIKVSIQSSGCIKLIDGVLILNIYTVFLKM